MKIEGTIEWFSGFYESIWSADSRLEDFFYMEGYDYDDVEIDYPEYEKDVANEITDIYEGWVKDVLGDVILITFQGITSPKYYNYSTDRIDVEYDITDEGVEVMKEKLKENYAVVKELVKRNHTSYDGFWSWLSNDVDDWFDKAFNDDEYREPAYFSCLLNYIIIAEWRKRGWDTDNFNYYAYEFVQAAPEGYLKILKRPVVVDWDTDGEEAPSKEVHIPVEVEEDKISDWLSDEYGFCVNSWKFKNND